MRRFTTSHKLAPSLKWDGPLPACRVGRSFPSLVLTPSRLYTSLPAFHCWRRLPARRSRSTHPPIMARSASALHQQVRINPRPFLWGPTRTRCTQYDPRTASIFTRLELFPRTVARPKALHWNIELRPLGLLCAAGGLLPSALCFACAPLAFFFSPHLSSIAGIDKM